jgi:hypothetical protein
MVRDGPVTLRVCIVEGDAAHLAIGDRVELATSRLGRLRIRHLPGPGNDVVWNDGEDVRVNSAVLVERVDPGSVPTASAQRQQAAGQTQAGARRFVPVGRFSVRTDDAEHARFDFLVGQTTMPTRDHEYPECIADVGDDEVIIRGVEVHERHGGHVILR